MIRSPQELSTPIRLAVNRKAVLFSHVLLAIVIAVHTALDPTSFNYQIILAFILSATLITLAFFRFFDLARLNSHPRAYLIVYQIFSFLGISFISDPATPYVVGVFIILFLMNLYYGSKGVWIMVACFAVTTITKYIYQSNVNSLTLNDKLNIIVTFFVFLATASFFVNIQKVYDWDRSRMTDAMKNAVREQKRLTVLINSMTESVLVLDKEGVVRLYNAAALGLFDTNATLSDRPLGSFAHLEDEKGNKVTAKDLLPNGSQPIIRNDIILRYSKEDTAALSIICTPIRSTFGQVADEDGYIISIQDITRQKSLEEERDEFISVISHELRTPVAITEANVSNAIFTADKNQDIALVKKSLVAAHDQVLYLASMLNDLSTLSRAERDKLDLNPEEIHPVDIINELVGNYTREAEKKGLSLHHEVGADTPATITSNQLYVKEILQNFVTNAIKYTREGSVTLRVKGNAKGVEFSIDDTGIGISKSDQKKIFDKFYRSEDYRTRESSGTGLGLYVTKKLAKIIGATFTVHSTLNKGSSFSVFIPDLKDLTQKS